MSKLNPEDARTFQILNPPVYWPQLGQFVIADRRLPDGTRQHVIKGRAAPGLVVGNAQVLGDADLRDIGIVLDPTPVRPNIEPKRRT